MNLSSIHSVVDLCQALVQIPSENPSGSAASHGEEAMASFVGGFLEDLHAQVEYEEIGPGRPNVYGLWPVPPGASQRILFAPHLDTVTVEGMTVDPFQANRVDGRLYGRGSSDTKGSMAAMLWAIKSVDLSKLNVAVGFAGLADEECEQLGAKVCAARKMADFVVVGEPTNLDVVYTHKGEAWIEIETRGRSAHASIPKTGVNAIDRMVDALKILNERFPQICPVKGNPVLGESTVSTGRIRGGAKINVVPDRCYAEVDIRILPGQESMAADVARFFEEQGVPAIVRPIKISAPLYTSPDHPFIKKFVALGSRLTGASWFCDAAFFALQGTPAIAIGPGSIAQAHTADEYIEIAELERGAEFFTNFLLSFGNG
ncbi:MAG: M20 family metallopeptidase [Verrucomicrobia bacterium]|nr:M20 family metallopeptidase [Verrucomicrobiota bacterium]